MSEELFSLIDKKEYGDAFQFVWKSKNKKEILQYRNKDGHTPLSYICSKENPKFSLIELYIQKSPDISATDNHGNTPLHHILMTIKKMRIKNWSVQGESGGMPAEYIIKNGLFSYYRSGIQQKFSHGQQISVSAELWGPKDQLTYYVIIDAPLLLIKKGANLNAANNQGVTPFHLACELGEPRILRACMKKETGTEITDNNGAGSLHYAAKSERFDGFKIIYNLQKKPDIIDNSGWSPLHYGALTEDSEEIIKFLLSKKADPSLVSQKMQFNIPEGSTAGDIAGSLKHEAIQKLLTK